MKSEFAAALSIFSDYPLWGFLATLIAYKIGTSVQQFSNNHALANPVLVAVVLLVASLVLTHTPYQHYFEGAQYIHFLLGPATVALAIPMHRNLHHIRQTARSLIPAVIVGSVTSAGTAMLISKWLGASPIVTASLVAHSATTPIAMSISQNIGGNESLAATFTLFTGMASVLLIGVTMKLLKISDLRAHGLAAGTTGHGLATAKMLTVSETAGAFGGLAIGFNGVLTAVIAPILMALAR